ncbi:MAG TPA: arylsulfotransferase family protein [Solirubrobacteraceae bacterium]
MPRLLVALVAPLAVALALAGATAARAASPAVSVYPSPGTKYNLPQSQITFRGIAPSAIGTVKVVGSSTGEDSGRIEGDSDNKGGSFLPSKPFKAGETVTVSTSLNIVGGRSGKFSFVVVHPSRPISAMPLPVVSPGSNGLQRFRSRPDLVPPSLTISKNSTPASEGDIFLAPQFGPSQNGPMILDPQGNVLWFLPFAVSRKLLITDFRVQTYNGQQVLTWFQGFTNHGSGVGQGVIWSRDYKQIATVNAGNGLHMDLHEFVITSGSHAWIICVSPVSLPNVPHKPVQDSVVQEIDIKTGLVMFEWHALDHVPLSDSSMSDKSPGVVDDPFHANSISFVGSNPVVSMRNTNAVYDIDRNTGKIVWTLGGKHPSFKMGSGTTTAFQHAAMVDSDGTITEFDDGAGPPRVHPFSRGIRVSLDTSHMTANLVREYDHSPQISSQFEGNVQQLSAGDVFMGWGQQPYFSEANAAGQQIFDAHFTVPTGSYRAYRFAWNAQPPTLPALAIAPSIDGSTDIYASWNGATDVASWQVLAGPAPQSLATIGVANRTGFETHIAVHSGSPYFAVQALNAAGKVLATSAVKSTPAHLAMYGRSVFVSGAGTGGLPASCFANHPCSVTTTVTAGRTVIATTGKESIGEGDGTLLYFTLTSAGRSLLSHASGHRLGVTVTLRDASGASASTGMTLVPFGTAGAAPTRAATNAPSLKFVGLTDFVSSASGVGGILAGCYAAAPCHVTTKITSGTTTIATTGSEFIGVGELSYLSFTLTAAGRSLLAHAPGNQLPAQVTLTNGSTTATASIALVAF